MLADDSGIRARDQLCICALVHWQFARLRRFVPATGLRQSWRIRDGDCFEEHAARTTYSRRCRLCGTLRVPDAFWQE